MRKTYGPLKQKNCKLGAICGGSCISKSKSCKVDLLSGQKMRLVAAAKKLKSPVTLLGEGVFGKVFENSDGTVTKEYKDQLKGVAKREAGYQRLAHKLGFAPRVVSVTGNSITMEKAKGMLLYDFIDTDPPDSEFVKVRKARKEIVLALHKAGFAHNDLHNRNIFWDTSTQKMSIIDFGLANSKPENLLVEYKFRAGAATDPTFDNIKDYKAWLKNQ